MKMRIRLFAILTLSLIVTCTFADRLITYPAPTGAPIIHDFIVTVRQQSNRQQYEWQKVDTYAWNVDHTENGKHAIVKTSVSSFEFEGKIVVKLRYCKGDIHTCSIRPLSYGIHPQVNGNEITFTLSEPRNLSVEVNGDRYHNLQFFANPISPKVRKNKHTRYFAPGYYDLHGDSIAVKSGETVYISGGAYIKGFLSVWQAHDVKILGTGIVNPERAQEGISVRYGKRVTVDGPLTTQLPCGESDSVDIRNTKVISWYGWGDGMNVFASQHVSYQHVFCRTSDDCSTIYCTRKGYHGSSRYIHVSDAVYWADVAHPIMIGLHGDISREEEVSDVVYENIDILQQREKQIDYQGCIAINNGDNILCHDITFRGIRIENIDEGMLFNFRVCYNRKYCHAPGRGIENVLLDNISYQGKQTNLSIISGYDDDRKIKNIIFRHLSINGDLIYDEMPQKPKWYKTADFARIFIGEHAEGITFSN